MNENEPTHRWVADRLGMSVAGVSLLRNGLRNPSMATMENIEKQFEWPMCDQVAARHDYGTELNKVLEQRFEQEQDET